MAKPVSLSVKSRSPQPPRTASVKALPRTTRLHFPIPISALVLFRRTAGSASWSTTPLVDKLNAGDAQKLATDVHGSIAGSMSAVRGGIPGVILGGGHIICGFLPPPDVKVFESKRAVARAAQPLKCPSAQPGMGDVQILGVISRDADEPRLAYLDEALPASSAMLELAAPLDASQVFRLSARCEEKKMHAFRRSRLPAGGADREDDARSGRSPARLQYPPRLPLVSAGGPGRLRAVPANRHRLQ